MRRRVGMADEADSKSVVGNHVRVQVPLPAFVIRSTVFIGFLMTARARFIDEKRPGSTPGLNYS